jgi:cation transport ATPase
LPTSISLVTDHAVTVLQVKTVVFDKTGTLTVGKPEVVSAVLFSSFSMEEFCDMVTAAEVGICISSIVLISKL